MGRMPHFSTRIFRMVGETKAGRLGPRRIFLMPRASRVSRMLTAFCSYQGKHQGKRQIVDVAFRASARPGPPVPPRRRRCTGPCPAGAAGRRACPGPCRKSGTCRRPGQHQGVLRGFFHKFRVIVAAGLGPSQPPTRKMWRNLPGPRLPAPWARHLSMVWRPKPVRNFLAGLSSAKPGSSRPWR